MSMRCKGRVFKDTGQGANFMVVLIGLVIIFKSQLTSLVQIIFQKITSESSGI
ncbi:Flp1 family type IVb pilin [[Clostridium] scindens]|uniref:Flp1 family type IVb pilin n=1 Tax=Clostridium scindens (strain JCM 10418 / VPI 12708) TaxID=29347 RepID=UPI0039F59DAB